MQNRIPTSTAALLLGVLVAGACSDASTPPAPTVIPPFESVAHSPADGAVVYLNDPITVSFSTQLDLDSVNPSTFVIEEFDASGQPTLVAVPGTYRLANNGTLLWFEPALPTDGAFTTAGLRAGRTYRVHVTDNLHDATGQRLTTARTFQFQTRTGNTLAALFRDRNVLGPGRQALTVPADPATLPMAEVRLTFDQPIDPTYDNFAWTVWLEYQDPADPIGSFRRIAASAELERNTAFDAVLVLRPHANLLPAITVRVLVAPTLRDLAGQDNSQTPGYDPVFGTFDT